MVNSVVQKGGSWSSGVASFFCVRRVQDELVADHLAEHRPGEGGRGQTDDQTVQDHLADIRFQSDRYGGRGWMGRCPCNGPSTGR